MTTPILHIGNKRYSTWSLRAWLPLRKARLDFEERLIPLYTPESRAPLAELSPARSVPVLEADGVRIWDSLSIAEWAAERAPHLWPADPGRRALARSASASMHSGFFALRDALSMNLGRDGAPLEIGSACAADIAKMIDMWRAVRASDEGFLFGDWSIADAFFTPVATRFRSYGVDLPDDAQAYVDRLLADPDYVDWRDAALQESWRVAEAEGV